MMEKQTPFSLIDPDILREPFASYRDLRDHHPVFCDPLTGIYILSRYEDLRTVAANHDVFSSDTRHLMNRDPALNEKIDALHEKDCLVKSVNTLVTNDPPSHKKYRGLVDHAFRTARIKAMTAYIESVVQETLDALAGKNSADMVPELAVKVPTRIIADQLGVPQERSSDVKRWSDALLAGGDITLTPDDLIEAAGVTIEMRNYLATELKRCRETPTDTIISELAHAKIEGTAVSNDEAVSILEQLLVAGNDTTTNTIGMGLAFMIEQGLEQELRNKPEKIPAFVEETLRLSTSLQGLFRRAIRDTEINGTVIPEGSTLMLRFAAGNRDERKFEFPDAVDLDRANAKQHLTFGHGIHHCVGHALARAELRAVFEAVIARLKNLRFAEPPELIIHSFSRGYSRLPLGYDPL